MRLSLLVLALVAVSVQAQIQPTACNKQSHTCVRSGDACTADLRNEGCNQANSQSVCRQCSGPDMVCHEGVCHDTVQSETEECNNSDHKFCKHGLDCDNGICRNRDRSDVLNYLGFGETCFENSECGNGLFCDDVSNICTLPEVNSGTAYREYYCDSDDQCPFGQYCENRGAGLKVCTDWYPANKRLGHACQTARQCGYSLSCVLTNPGETNSAFQKRLCLPPFQLKEGEPCQPNVSVLASLSPGFRSDHCQSGLVCDGNSRTCAKPNLAYNGQGCTENSECGRLMRCACPSSGDGRSRCVERSEVQNKREIIVLGKKLIEFGQCLEKNKCTLNTVEGSCAKAKCGKFWEAEPLPKCRGETEPFPAYKGVSYAGAATIRVSSLLLTSLVAAVWVALCV